MFEIKFVNLKEKKIMLGSITINNFQEYFESSTSFWTTEKYQEHWKNELINIITGKKSKTLLITNMVNPKYANFFITWAFYNINNKIHIQNQLLFTENLKSPFNIENLSEITPERETVAEDGDKISEWSVSIYELQKFLENQERVSDSHT